MPNSRPDSPPQKWVELLVIVVALLLPTAVTWMYFIALDGAPPIVQKGAYAVGKTIQFALPVVWMCLVLRQWDHFRRPSCWSLIFGPMFGLLVACAIAALYFAVLKPAGLLDEALLAVRAKAKSFGVASPLAYLTLAVFYSTIHSLLEEYYWRWFVFGQLARQTSWPTAIAISSIGFAAHHVLVLSKYFGWASPLTWLFTACIILGGAVWAWLYRASDSLAPSWLSHALVDAAIFAIGYQIIRGA
jgi:uncharacterized protein